MGNSLFWALCRCIHHLWTERPGFTLWERIHGKSHGSKVDPPHRPRIQRDQLRGQEGRELSTQPLSGLV